MSKLFSTSKLKKHFASMHPVELAAVLVFSNDSGYSRAKSSLENIKKRIKNEKPLFNVIQRVQASSVDMLLAS